MNLLHLRLTVILMGKQKNLFAFQQICSLVGCWVSLFVLRQDTGI